MIDIYSCFRGKWMEKDHSHNRHLLLSVNVWGHIIDILLEIVSWTWNCGRGPIFGCVSERQAKYACQLGCPSAHQFLCENIASL